jgi:hypothetical protein
MTAEQLPPWVRMALGYDGDPKVAALARFGADAGLCRDLHLATIRYCGREKTDGWVPPWEPGRLAWPLSADRAAELIDHLCEVELLVVNAEGIAPAIATGIATAIAPAIATAITPDMGGWLVVNYAKWQETAAEIEAYSAAQAERGRKGADKRWSRDPRIATAIAPATPNGSDRYSARDGDRMAELELEGESIGPARNTGARDDAAAAADEIDRLIQAQMFSLTGKTITTDEARAIWVTLSTGRTISNPAAFVRKCLGTKAEARRHLPHRDSTTGSARPASEIIAAQRRPGGPSADPAHQAQIARKLLAEAQAPPDPLPGADHDGEHDDEHDRQPAETEPLDAEPADDGDPPW